MGESGILKQGFHPQPVVQHEVEVAANDQIMGHAFNSEWRKMRPTAPGGKAVSLSRSRYRDWASSTVMIEPVMKRAAGPASSMRA